MARARSMAALCLAKARSSMTAPMKLDRSVTGPMVEAVGHVDEVGAAAERQIDCGTYALDAAEHF